MESSEIEMNAYGELCQISNQIVTTNVDSIMNLVPSFQSTLPNKVHKVKGFLFLRENE